MREARDEMGPDAMVLHARESGGPLKSLRRASVEVVAAADDGAADEVAPSPPPDVGAAGASRSESLADVHHALNELRDQVERLQGATARSPVGHFGPLLGACYEHLREQAVSDVLAYDVCHRAFRSLGASALDSADDVLTRVQTVLTRMTKDAGPLRITPGEPRVLAFIGPTGTGKTILVAKLAARFVRDYQRRVALITTDTVRVAAIPQLRTYGEIMGIDVSVAYAASELRTQVEAHSDCDVILVDTPGRSPANASGIADVAALAREVPTATTYLVLSAATKLADLRRACEAFRPCRYAHVAITKVDETECIGPVFEMATDATRSIAFIGSGQEVPGDVARSTADALASLLMSGFEPQTVNAEVGSGAAREAR